VKVIDFVERLLDEQKRQSILINEIPPLRTPKDLPTAYIFDLDGVLCHIHRSPWDWTKIYTDTPIYSGIGLIDRLFETSRVFILTSRDEDSRLETEKWLKSNGVKYHELLMRNNDNAHSEVKKQLYQDHVEGKYNVLGIFEDRNSAVNMWRAEGLPAYQFGNGEW